MDLPHNVYALTSGKCYTLIFGLLAQNWVLSGVAIFSITIINVNCNKSNTLVHLLWCMCRFMDGQARTSATSTVLINLSGWHLNAFSCGCMVNHLRFWVLSGVSGNVKGLNLLNEFVVFLLFFFPCLQGLAEAFPAHDCDDDAWSWWQQWE